MLNPTRGILGIPYESKPAQAGINGNDRRDTPAAQITSSYRAGAVRAQKISIRQCANGDPGVTRTRNPLLRRQVLYPVELRGPAPVRGRGFVANGSIQYPGGLGDAGRDRPGDQCDQGILRSNRKLSE